MVKSTSFSRAAFRGESRKLRKGRPRPAIQIKISQKKGWHVIRALHQERWRGVYSCEFFVGLCRPVPQILTLFQAKKCHFPRPFSDQTTKILPPFHYLDSGLD